MINVIKSEIEHRNVETGFLMCGFWHTALARIIHQTS